MRHVRHLLTIILLTAGVTACNSGPATCGTARPVSAASTTTGPSGPVVYVAGDSIVASGILSNPDRDGFAARLRVRLCGDRCGQPGQPTVISVAAGGTRLTDPKGKDPNALIRKWPTVLDATPRPTVIVVGIGINDVALTTDAQFGDAYTRIVVSARQRGIHVIPATMSPCNATLKHCGILQPQRQALNNWLRAYWGADNVADFSTAVRAPGTETLDPAHDSGDGLHLNAAGTQRIADSVPLDKIPQQPPRPQRPPRAADTPSQRTPTCACPPDPASQDSDQAAAIRVGHRATPAEYRHQYEPREREDQPSSSVRTEARPELASTAAMAVHRRDRGDLNHPVPQLVAIVRPRVPKQVSRSDMRGSNADIPTWTSNSVSEYTPALWCSGRQIRG